MVVVGLLTRDSVRDFERLVGVVEEQRQRHCSRLITMVVGAEELTHGELNSGRSGGMMTLLDETMCMAAGLDRRRRRFLFCI
ncbi:diaminopimelate decarboxylase [Sesbania bispinosa]|nr:diaminopimelate decarboxylase [Sesbania bispinosa]